jgi:hypothetical protein
MQFLHFSEEFFQGLVVDYHPGAVDEPTRRPFYRKGREDRQENLC